MLFNSWSFLFFFPVVVGLYWALPHRLRWAWLLAASCVFYMAFVPKYVLILFAVIGIDYVAGLLIARSDGAARRRWLLLSIVANLAVLGFFKYFNFFADNARALAQLIGWNLPLPVLQILLPIGLSFHVFQSLSYTIEVYRGNQAPERHLGIYALYVMFWPQLVAGPIERPQNLLHQFHAEHRFEFARLADGLRLMGWGFFKKVVVADQIAALIGPIYASPLEHGGLTLLLVAALFTVQVYGDFSGYSDIARGAAKVMGYDLMVNFDRPLFAKNIAEFWRRWHISLSSWLNDYVFMPLAYGWKGAGRAGAAAAALVTFFLSGLWHGANWTFVVYGVMHGVVVACEIVTRRARKRVAARVPQPLWAFVAWASTLGFVTFSFIFFRVPTLAQATYFATHLHTGLWTQLTTVQGFVAAIDPLHGSPRRLAFVLLVIGLLLTGEALEARAGVIARLAAWPLPARWAAYLAGLALIALGGSYQNRAFIYFQF